MRRIAGLLLVACLVFGIGVALTRSAAQATNAGTEPILSYPATDPTPTMGQPSAQAAVLASVNSSSLSPAGILAAWQVVDTPAVLPGEGGRWVEREGRLYQNGMNPAASLSAAETALLSPEPYADVTLSVSFYDAGNGNVGLLARHSEAGFYQVRLQTDPSYDGTALVVEKVVGGAAAPLLLNTGEPLYQPHSWHTLALSVQRGAIFVTLDGQVVAEAEDTTPLPAGRVGLSTRALGGISFDQIILAAEGR